MSKDRISRLCEYIDKNKAKNYPIHNSILSTETDYIKNSYFKMLAVILEQGQEIFDSQRALFERQIAGVDCDYQATDYFRQALEIEIEEYIDFTTQCKEMVLRYRFILDAILLTAVEQFSEEQIKLVASFAEDMKLGKNEVEYLSLLAKSILEQNMEYYGFAENNRPKQIPYTLFDEYLVYTSGIVCNSDEEFVVRGAEQFKMTLDQTYGNITQNKVVFRNLAIDMKEFPLNFSGCAKVEIIECVFIGENHSISFKRCKEIEITNCEFRDFKTRVITENENVNCNILHCKFINCKHYYNRETNDWQELGGVIYTENANRNGKNIIRNSEFKNCGGVNSANYYSSAVISNCNCEVYDCSFYDCWNYSRENTIDPEHYYRSLFNASVTGNQNEIVGSAKFRKG